MCCSSWHLNVGRGDSESILSALLNIPAVMIFAGVARNDRSSIVRIFDTAILIACTWKPYTTLAIIILRVTIYRTFRALQEITAHGVFPIPEKVSASLVASESLHRNVRVSSSVFRFCSFPSQKHAITAIDRAAEKTNCITLHYGVRRARN